MTIKLLVMIVAIALSSAVVLPTFSQNMTGNMSTITGNLTGESVGENAT